ncbi:hypothetical protein BT96DRAFT_1003816 [Gymnopus androsaceus JB14]|uniref:Uncharacterized protein n=1 Tax=Gymnopus androsaceus JB14 TaxID=1447944 RepID=A0A6A4GUQ4_9AGAR|nr:hypothetical protein BT96DRAFT_1003816 [Gymnopus androsaceus JB14]
MSEAAWQPILAIPASDMVDASQIRHQALDNDANLNTVLLQTAASIAAPTPNYQPFSGRTLFALGNENPAGTSTRSATSAAAHFFPAALVDVSKVVCHSDMTGALGTQNSAVPTCSDTSSSTPLGNKTSVAPSANKMSAASLDNNPSPASAAPAASSNASTAPASASTEDPASSSPADPTAPTGALADSTTASSPAPDANSAAPAAVPTAAPIPSGDDVAGAPEGGSQGSSAADPVCGPDSSSVDPPPMKKKRLEMADVDELLDEQDALFTKYVEKNGVTINCVKKLAQQLPSMKKQKKASDYNILVYFKGKELNKSQAKGSRTALKDLHEKVKHDEDLQDILNDPDAMKALWQRYGDAKVEEKVVAVRVSKHAQAKGVAEKINFFQQESDFMFESANANSFGMVVHGLFESTYFRKGVQDMLNLYKNYVTSMEKAGTRKLYQSEMAHEILTSGCYSEDVMGLTNISMSYISFAKTIAVLYKVNIKGWPEDVPCSYPQHPPAEQIKILYNARNSSAVHWYTMTPAEARLFKREAEKNGELEPRIQKKRADAGSKHGQDDDDDDSKEEEEPRPTKSSKCTRVAATDDDDDDASDEDEVHPAKKSKGAAVGRGKKKSVSGPSGKKLVGGSSGCKVAGGRAKKSTGANKEGAGGKRSVGGKRKSAVGVKKSALGKSKGKKKSAWFVVSDSDPDFDNGDASDDDEKEFLG